MAFRRSHALKKVTRVTSVTTPATIDGSVLGEPGFDRLQPSHYTRNLRITAPRPMIARTPGRLAQLVRAPALQAGGRRFESFTAHHANQ
jgi:hypothetical protein